MKKRRYEKTFSRGYDQTDRDVLPMGMELYERYPNGQNRADNQGTEHQHVLANFLANIVVTMSVCSGRM